MTLPATLAKQKPPPKPVITIIGFDVDEILRLRDEWILDNSTLFSYKMIGLSCGLSPDRVKQIVLRMRKGGA